MRSARRPGSRPVPRHSGAQCGRATWGDVALRARCLVHGKAIEETVATGGFQRLEAAAAGGM
jgi:tagatose-1,6-bisphosphate aldolase